jgi:hypothetical protein
MAVGRTGVPDFDRVVIGTRHDRLAVWGEGNGIDAVTVGIVFGRLELESSCEVNEKGVKSDGMAVGGALNG